MFIILVLASKRGNSLDQATSRERREGRLEMIIKNSSPATRRCNNASSLSRSQSDGLASLTCVKKQGSERESKAKLEGEILG